MDAKNILIVIAGVLSVVSCLPYVIDIAKHKTHPNLVTWITWCSVIGISTIAALSDHAYHTAILSGCLFLTDLIIIVMSIKRGVKKYTRFDFVCQALALIGVILWRLTGNPSTAIAMSLLVIAIGALPTLRHAYRLPYEETWQGFVMGALAGVLTLLSLSQHTFVSLGLPVMTVVNCTIIATIITSRRRILADTKATI